MTITGNRVLTTSQDTGDNGVCPRGKRIRDEVFITKSQVVRLSKDPIFRPPFLILNPFLWKNKQDLMCRGVHDL